MTLELTRRLLTTGAIAARDLEAALYLSVVRGVSIARALVDRGVLSERSLEEELSRRSGLPLRQVTPSAEIADKLPRGMCRMLAAVPLRHDPVSGVVEIAAVDPLDGHISAEFTFHLGAPIRVQRATMAAIEEAIRRLELADGGTSSRSRRRTPAFPHGAPDTVPPSPPPSAPPPDEVPIPLVRRVSAQSHPELRIADAALHSAPEALRQGRSDVSPSVDWDATGRIHDEPVARHDPEELLPLGSADSEDDPASRRRHFRDIPLDGPSVSFPSAPPPPGMRLPSSPDDPKLAIAARAALQEVESLRPKTGTSSAQAESAVADEVTADDGVVGEEEPTPIDADHPDVDGPEPETIPRAPDAGWAPTLPELFDLIARARGRDDLLDMMLRAMTMVARRGALFVLRKDAYHGWSANPAFGSEDSLRTLVIPAGKPSIFATSAAAGFYLGPIPQTPVHRGLLEVMGRATPDVAVYVVKLKGRATIVLVADELDDTLIGTRTLGEIARRASETLTRILTQK